MGLVSRVSCCVCAPRFLITNSGPSSCALSVEFMVVRCKAHPGVIDNTEYLSRSAIAIQQRALIQLTMTCALPGALPHLVLHDIVRTTTQGVMLPVRRVFRCRRPVYALRLLYHGSYRSYATAEPPDASKLRNMALVAHIGECLSILAPLIVY